ncbi:MAG: hypothetical protein WBH28_08960 [Fuerstiella sp.]
MADRMEGTSKTMSFETDYCPACLERRNNVADRAQQERFLVGTVRSDTGKCDRCTFQRERRSINDRLRDTIIMGRDFPPGFPARG